MSIRLERDNAPPRRQRRAQAADHQRRPGRLGAAAHDAHARGFIRRYLGRYREAIATLITQGIERGELRPIEPRDAANALLAPVASIGLQHVISAMKSRGPDAPGLKPGELAVPVAVPAQGDELQAPGHV